MSKKKIESYIPAALKLIETHMAAEDKSVPKVYNGYIASMGAAMQQSGLLPTLAIYSVNSGATAGDKTKLIQVLTRLLTGMETADDYYKEMIPKGEKIQDDSLLRFAADRQHLPMDLRRIRRDLRDASIAVKLCLRTFKLTGNGQE